VLWQPYVRADVWGDWDAQARTTFGIDQVPLNQQATWLEFAGGLTTKVNNRLSFYGQAGLSVCGLGNHRRSRAQRRDG